MVQCVREVWSGLRRWNTLKVLEASCGSEGEEHSSNGLSASWQSSIALWGCQLGFFVRVVVICSSLFFYACPLVLLVYFVCTLLPHFPRPFYMLF